MQSEIEGDGRKRLKLKPPNECIEYFHLLVKVLEKSQSTSLAEARIILSGLKDIPQNEIERISKLSAEQLETCSSEDSVAILVKGINNFRGKVYNEEWESWGARIRDQRNLKKFHPLKLKAKTRRDIHEFFVTYKDIILDKYQTQVGVAELFAKDNKSVKCSSFSHTIDSHELPSEKYFDDLQCTILLNICNLHISDLMTRQSEEGVYSKARISEAEKKCRELEGKITKVKQAMGSMFLDQVSRGEPAKNEVHIIKRSDSSSFQKTISKLLEALE